MVLVALPIDTTDPLVKGAGSLNLTSGFVSGRSEKNNKTINNTERAEGDFSNSIQLTKIGLKKKYVKINSADLEMKINLAYQATLKR